MQEGIKVSTEQAAEIEEKTRSQAGSTEWQSEREWRLTASHFGAICKMTDRRDVEKFCKDMYDPPNLMHVPAIRHGLTYESVALEKFSEITGKKVLKSGLCVDPELPFIGATPDAFVEGEDAVIEVIVMGIVACTSIASLAGVRVAGSIPFPCTKRYLTLAVADRH